MRARLREAGERGSMALFVAVFAPAMIFLAGLVIDGGAALEARQRATDIAEQAARAGAGQCDVALLRSTGQCRLTDFAAVTNAARPYMADQGVTEWHAEWREPVPGGAGQYYGVRIFVTIEFRTTLLGIVPAYETLTVRQYGDAVAVTGL